MAAEQQAAGENKTYRVLARKYRPQDFSTLIGQEPMVRTLTNAFALSRIAQAWMLTGVRGVGKTTTARILARALNYKSATVDRPSIDLVSEGEHCRAIMEGRHIDVMEMDAASHTGIDHIRDLIDQSRYSPMSARYKIYIIDEVHMLSTAAFNGLLKTLEEPPPHVKFIFATTEIRKVPITVLSRCQRFDLRRVDSIILKQHLARIAAIEGVEAEDEALAMIARAGEGSVRDAISMLDQAIAHGDGHVLAEPVRMMLGLADRGRIIDLFEAIMRGQASLALELFKNLYNEGSDPHVIISELAEFNHLVTRLNITAHMGEDNSLSEEEYRRGSDLAKTLDLRTLSQNWQMLLKGLNEIDQAPRPYQAAEMLLIRLSAAADLPPLDEVIKQVMEMRGRGVSTILPTSSIPIMQAPASEPQEKKTLEQFPKSVKRFSDKNCGENKQLEQISDPMESHSALEQLSDKNSGENKELDKFVEPRKTKDTLEPVKNETDEKIRLENFDAILGYADKMRDLSFKTHLKEYVRPLHICHGVFEFAATEQAPRLLSNLIATTLRDWTGERWTVTAQADKGGMTINEKEQAQREALLSDASQDEEVNSILRQFPGAKIVDVRLAVANENEIGEESVELNESEEG